MDEQKVDRRIQRTRQILREALIALMLEKSYEKITIQDIIERANVGRATFYNHYQDKDDLLLRGVAEFTQQEMDEAPPEAHPQPAAMTKRDTIATAGMFRHSQQNERLHQVMFKRSRENLILEQVTAVLQTNVANQLQQLAPATGTPAVPIPILTQFISGGLLSLINWWHDQKLPYTPEEMDAFVQQMVMPGVWQVLGEKEEGA